MSPFLECKTTKDRVKKLDDELKIIPFIEIIF